MTAHSLDLTRSDLVAALISAADSNGPAGPPAHVLVEVARGKLAAAIDSHHNDDALARRRALAACAAGRAAFWTTATYHRQKACTLQLAAHTLPTLEAALDETLTDQASEPTREWRRWIP